MHAPPHPSSTAVTTASPPWALEQKLTVHYRGNIDVLRRPGLCVVGSRRPSPESLEWMESELKSFLKAVHHEAVLISGGAVGVDQRAHAVAMRASCPTAVFLPSGLNNIYPPSLNSWVSGIVERGGVVLSEFGLDTPVRRWNFHKRNHSMAAMAACTLMVEGRLRSGSMITARAALNMGKNVGCLPQGPMSQAQGFSEIMRLGGELITTRLDMQALFARSAHKGYGKLLQ